MTDVLLFQTTDNGDISATDGVVELTNGLETAAYLSLFGGNIEDDGTNTDNSQWWGNAITSDVANRMTSRTQFLLDSTPASSGNLKRIVDAAKSDLAWLENAEVEASIPGRDKVQLTINIGEQSFVFYEEWART